MAQRVSRSAAGRRWALVVALVTSVASLSLSGCILPGKASVEGVARDVSGTAVADVEVSLYPSGSADPLVTTTTGPNGGYRFDVDAGYYRLGVHDPAGEFVDYWHSGATSLAGASILDASGGSTVTVDPTLVTASSAGRASGVVSAAGGPPLAGIEVQLLDWSSGAALGTASTDSVGGYSFGGLVPGSYTLRFADPTHTFGTTYAGGARSRGAAELVTVATGSTATVDATLHPAGAIAGLVHDGGAASAVVLVLARDEADAFVAYADVEAGDTFRIDGLSPGRYDLGFLPRDDRWRSATLGTPGAVDLEHATVVDVAPEATAEVEDRIVGADCDPAVFHPYADLHGRIQTGARLRGCDLDHANLRDADLYTSDLTAADLGGADLAGTRLQDARLVGADLVGASFSTSTELFNADATGADFHGDDLAGADLTMSRLIGADLRNTTMSYAAFIGANLTRADLSGSNDTGTFMGAVLDEANFTNATGSPMMEAVSLYHTNFTGVAYLNPEFDGASRESTAIWTGASLRGVLFGGGDEGGRPRWDLRGIDLSGVDLTGGRLLSNDFGNAKFVGATLAGAYLRDSVFAGADLSHADLTGADTRNAIFTGAIWNDTTCPDGTNSNDHANTCAGHL